MTQTNASCVKLWDGKTAWLQFYHMLLTIKSWQPQYFFVILHLSSNDNLKMTN